MLTNKQEMFCKEYIVDFNATQAAIRSGYSSASANQSGCDNLAKPIIQNRIKELIEQRNNRVQITADDVLINLYKMAMLDISDVINDNGTVKPISEWTKDWRIAVGGIDVIEQVSGDDVLITFIKKIKGVDKIRIWELIGKHVGVKAWEDKLNISGEIKANISIVPIKTDIQIFASKEDEVK